MPTPLSPLVARIVARRLRHRSVAHRYAAEIERHARQVTLEVGRDQVAAATTLVYQMLEHIHRLQGELRAIGVIDDIAPEAKRSGTLAA